MAFVPQADAENELPENPPLARGVIVNMFLPPPADSPKSPGAKNPSGPQLVSVKNVQEPAPRGTLDSAADKLLAQLKQTSSKLKESGRRERIEIDGQSALSVKLTNDSPLGGSETEWLVAVLQPQGMLYFVCAAPVNEYAEYEATFQKIISSVRLSQ